MSHLVWIPDKEYEWLLAEVVETKDENVVVIVNDDLKQQALGSIQSRTIDEGDEVNSSFSRSYLVSHMSISSITSEDYSKPVTIAKSKVCEFHSSHLEDFDDLCAMTKGILHEGPILHILRRRFLKNQIYTYAGDILISMNPYTIIPNLYENPMTYYKKKNTESVEIPHVYVVANSALIKLSESSDNNSAAFKRAKNQCVVISGESGAGKTEASKYLINFLIEANDIENASESQSIKDVIIHSTHVLESFGNAETVRNHNSSRFGKYVKLQYTKQNVLVSANTEGFLLEKSRIVSVGRNERNYHVFYQLLNGIETVNPSAKAKLRLSSVKDYRILVSHGHTTISVSKDQTDFTTLCDALTKIGCSETDINSLWGILAAILHLGNATFIPAIDETTPVGLSLSSATLYEISDILGVDEQELMKTLTSHIINTRRGHSIKVKLLNVAESTNNVNGLIKKLYHAIFNWLLKTINDYNSSFAYDSGSNVSNDRNNDDSNSNNLKFIGILDIFGFEILEKNSFEQLCINFTNEKLQQQFNDLIFASEQKLYIKEGLTWTKISYHDNQDIIDLISKKPTGLLNILEEHCMMNRGTDDMLLLNVYHQTHGDRADKLYIKPRFGNDPYFTVKHFAGGVTYNIEGFISKNYDILQDDLTELMESSSNGFLTRVLEASKPTDSSNQDEVDDDFLAMSPRTRQLRPQRTSKALASLVTVTSSVRSQIDSLMYAVRATELHYIKCIKPNSLKAPGVFESSLAMTQIRYSDVIEVVRIRRERFPIRLRYAEFYTIYSPILRQLQKLVPGEKFTLETMTDEQLRLSCKLITDKYLPEKSYQYGLTLLFLKENAAIMLNETLEKCIVRHRKSIEKAIHVFVQRKRDSKVIQVKAIEEAVRLKLEEEEEARLEEIASRLREEAEAYHFEEEAQLLIESELKKLESEEYKDIVTNESIITEATTNTTTITIEQGAAVVQDGDDDEEDSDPNTNNSVEETIVNTEIVSDVVHLSESLPIENSNTEEIVEISTVEIPTKVKIDNDEEKMLEFQSISEPVPVPVSIVTQQQEEIENPDEENNLSLIIPNKESQSSGFSPVDSNEERIKGYNQFKDTSGNKNENDSEMEEIFQSNRDTVVVSTGEFVSDGEESTNRSFNNSPVFDEGFVGIDASTLMNDGGNHIYTDNSDRSTPFRPTSPFDRPMSPFDRPMSPFDRPMSPLFESFEPTQLSDVMSENVTIPENETIPESEMIPEDMEDSVVTTEVIEMKENATHESSFEDNVIVKHTSLDSPIEGNLNEAVILKNDPIVIIASNSTPVIEDSDISNIVKAIPTDTDDIDKNDAYIMTNAMEPISDNDSVDSYENNGQAKGLSPEDMRNSMETNDNTEDSDNSIQPTVIENSVHMVIDGTVLGDIAIENIVNMSQSSEMEDNYVDENENDYGDENRPENQSIHSYNSLVDTNTFKAKRLTIPMDEEAERARREREEARRQQELERLNRENRKNNLKASTDTKGGNTSTNLNITIPSYTRNNSLTRTATSRTLKPIPETEEMKFQDDDDSEKMFVPVIGSYNNSPFESNRKGLPHRRNEFRHEEEKKLKFEVEKRMHDDAIRRVDEYRKQLESNPPVVAIDDVEADSRDDYDEESHMKDRQSEEQRRLANQEKQRRMIELLSKQASTKQNTKSGWDQFVEQAVNDVTEITTEIATSINTGLQPVGQWLSGLDVWGSGKTQ